MTVESEKMQNIMALLGGLVVAGVILVFTFKALNNLGLSDRKGIATVMDKKYQPQRTIYVMNATTKTLSVPQIEPEKFLLRLKVDDKVNEFDAGKEIYNSINLNDKVHVTYKRLRLTGGISVTGVTR